MMKSFYLKIFIFLFFTSLNAGFQYDKDLTPEKNRDLGQIELLDNGNQLVVKDGPNMNNGLICLLTLSRDLVEIKTVSRLHPEKEKQFKLIPGELFFASFTGDGIIFAPRNDTILIMNFIYDFGGKDFICYKRLPDLFR